MKNSARHVRTKRARWICTLVASVVACQASADTPPLAHALFQDHAVLQSDAPIVVWGTAAPQEQINVTLASSTQTARADGSGQWTATLPPMPAGGPYTLELRGSSGASQVINDVLVGDVWLCSGQSNMELSVERALDVNTEVANSANDSIRLLTVPRASHAQPQRTFAAPVQWLKAGPTTVRPFSAACLFFARELKKTINVPMGLIQAAWGGTRIETWMSADALRSTAAYDEALDILSLYAQDPFAAHGRFGSLWEKWWRGQFGAGSQPWSESPRGEWRVAPMQLGQWEKWGVPELANYNGMVWYRTSVTLSAKQAAQESTLSLGIVDEVDQTWINGKPIGAGTQRKAAQRGNPVTDPGPVRTYHLPAGSLRAGENSIVVNDLDTYAFGGLHGPAENRVLRFEDGQAVRLDGEWRYQVPPAFTGLSPRAPWEPVAGLGVLYNAMIAPLGNLKVRGVTWYQGESNTEQASRYADLLSRFMGDWRKRFGADLPFLIVQLANYGRPPTTPAESSWAALREAQRMAVSRDPHAGLVVAIDIGERYDIHPSNKQEVGRRLARAARRVVYGEQIAPSGPRPLAARRESKDVLVTFADVADTLITYSADAPVGFELCGAAAGSCRYAHAEIQKDRVLLRADVSAPSKVRYCWADSPVCTLFDTANLPAGPFEMEVQ